MDFPGTDQTTREAMVLKSILPYLPSYIRRPEKLTPKGGKGPQGPIELYANGSVTESSGLVHSLAVSAAKIHEERWFP